MRRTTVGLAAFVAASGLTSPALADHTRDAWDNGNYWEIVRVGGGLANTSTGGWVCNTCVRPGMASQASSYTTTGTNYDDARWKHQKSAYVGSYDAYITCNGNATSIDARYYTYGSTAGVNQAGYCNAWVTVDTAPVYIDYIVGLTDQSSYSTRRVSWDSTRAWW